MLNLRWLSLPVEPLAWHLTHTLLSLHEFSSIKKLLQYCYLQALCAQDSVGTELKHLMTLAGCKAHIHTLQRCRIFYSAGPILSARTDATSIMNVKDVIENTRDQFAGWVCDVRDIARGHILAIEVRFASFSWNWTESYLVIAQSVYLSLRCRLPGLAKDRLSPFIIVKKTKWVKWMHEWIVQAKQFETIVLFIGMYCQAHHICQIIPAC